MRNRRPRGITSLSAVLGLVGMMAVLGLLLMDQVERARLQVTREKGRLAAEVLARSGVDYARASLRTHRWPSTERAWTSPALGGRDFFRVQVLQRPGGLVLRSTGVVHQYPSPVERTVEERL